MKGGAALPFTIRRSEDVIARGRITTTVETVHGLLRLAEETLVLQWRVLRETDRIGDEIRSDQEMGDVNEVAIPLTGIAGAAVRHRRVWPWRYPVLVLTAADLRAFEPVTGPGGLRLDHPAELVLRLRAGDRLAAAEFAADLAVAIAERAMRAPHTLRVSEPPRATDDET